MKLKIFTVLVSLSLLVIGIMVVDRAFANESEDLSDTPSKIDRLISELNTRQEIENRMTAAILKTNRWYHRRPYEALLVARTIHKAAIDHDQEPWIALAIARRESAFSHKVRKLLVKGSRGEEGFFQIMPKSVPSRACAKGRNMGNMEHNADAAMCWLAEVRRICNSDDPWVYVPAYGVGFCPSEQEGRYMESALKARRFLCEMVGVDKCNLIWPS